MTQLRNEIKTELGVGVEDPEIMQLNANIGAVNVELRKYQAAKLDFERYLVLAPGAQDRQRVVDQIAALDRYLLRAAGS